jgi:RluA family pseudouridine synthase
MLDILYEDDALLFVNKPAGIVVQRGYDAEEPVLLEIAAAYAGTIFLMQRLDRGTSGVMFFSKLASINANLTRQFEGKRIRKRYLALCEGELAERQTIDAPLIRIGPISFGVGDGGKRAITIVTPIRATKTGSLVAVDLLTGRTHQIRVHLDAIGHPVAGDPVYGTGTSRRGPAGLERLFLHAWRLELNSPTDGHLIRATAPLPPELTSVLDRLREVVR